MYTLQARDQHVVEERVSGVRVLKWEFRATWCHDDYLALQGLVTDTYERSMPTAMRIFIWSGAVVVDKAAWIMNRVSSVSGLRLASTVCFGNCNRLRNCVDTNFPDTSLTLVVSVTRGLTT